MTIAVRIYEKAYGRCPTRYWNRGMQKSDIVFLQDDNQSLYDNAISEVSMDMLREERNRKLAETDWWAGQDLTMTQDQKDYRQALRDLPSTAEPQLDENGQLTNVTWPTKPE